MGIETERLLRRWRWIAGSALGCSGLLLVLLVIAVVVLAAVLLRQPARLSDDRLLGTWQCDADRTMAEMRERRHLDDVAAARVRKVFEKGRITFTATTFTIEGTGAPQTHRYEVVAREPHAVVIRDLDPFFPEVGDLMVINFELGDPDCFWSYIGEGGAREFHRRVK